MCSSEKENAPSSKYTANILKAACHLVDLSIIQWFLVLAQQTRKRRNIICHSYCHAATEIQYTARKDFINYISIPHCPKIRKNAGRLVTFDDRRSIVTQRQKNVPRKDGIPRDKKRTNTHRMEMANPRAKRIRAEVMMDTCLYQTISSVLAEGAGIVMGTTLTDGSLTLG